MKIFEPYMQKKLNAPYFHLIEDFHGPSFVTQLFECWQTNCLPIPLSCKIPSSQKEEYKKALLNIKEEFWQTLPVGIGLFTSGTMALPKLVIHPIENLVKAALRVGDFFSYNSKEDFSLITLPLSQTGGLMTLIRALVYQMKYAFISPFELQHNLELTLKAYPKATLLSIVPTQLLLWQKKWSNSKEINPLKYFRKFKSVLIGGDFITLSDSSIFFSSPFSSCFYQSYGMTETLGAIAVSPLSFENKNILRVIEKDSLFFEKETLYYKNSSPYSSLALGYLSLSSEEFYPLISPFNTQDRGEFLTPETFRLRGREGEIIKRGGTKITPEFLESFPKKYGLKSLALGIPDPLYGEIPVLVLEEDEIKNQEHSFTLLKQDLKESLSSFQKPEIKIVPNLEHFFLQGKKARQYLKNFLMTNG